MALDEALTARRAAVLDRWFQAVVATYPEDSARLIAGVADPFGNPVGSTLREGLGKLFDALVGGSPAAEFAVAVDGIVRIRAVQEFPPSAAVAFVFDLKGILRDELSGAGLSPAEQSTLEAGVDRMALAAFDVYMQCREKIFQIRVREIKESNLLAARFGA